MEFCIKKKTGVQKKILLKNKIPLALEISMMRDKEVPILKAETLEKYQ